MLVMTAHKNYLRLMLKEKELEQGQWKSANGRDRWSEDHGYTFSGLSGKTVHFLMLG